MECPNCGAILNEGIKNFCEFCGFKIKIDIEERNEPLMQEKVRKVSRRRCC
ncbi:MAG: hypothetical protein ACFFBK_14735 [Promethearchaeota archaeon]